MCRRIAHVAAKDKGLTERYVSPNARDLAPRFGDGEGYWTSFYLNPLGFGVSTKVRKERGIPAPASWEDLLRPELGNQVPMPSPRTSGTGHHLVVGLVQLWGEDRAFDYDPSIQTYT
jgi:iron(III) transport system substrate-binding protein